LHEGELSPDTTPGKAAFAASDDGARLQAFATRRAWFDAASVTDPADGALAGEIGPRPDAEGETAPETLKQKDRDGLETLESRARLRAPSPKEQGAPRLSDGVAESLRRQGQRGCGRRAMTVRHDPRVDLHDLTLELDIVIPNV
jgi:hypothetical protein